MNISDLKSKLVNQIFDQLLIKFGNCDFLRLGGDCEEIDSFKFNTVLKLSRLSRYTLGAKK